MSTDFLPARDADLDLWQQNFNDLIQAGPGTYGLDATYASAIAPLSADFTTKLAIAVNPSTRTKVTVASKDASKAALKSFIRVGAAIVQATPSVTNEAKESLGLPVHNNSPSPIPAPGTYPIIGVTPSGPLLHTLRFSDQATPDSRRKPNGAKFLMVTSKVSATVITDPEQLTDTDIVTRAPHLKQFGAGDAGKVAYYAAKWVTGTGLEGPWSAIQSAGVAA